MFEPEFMNSAVKEVLMDMAEQRHLLPVYRSDKLYHSSTEMGSIETETTLYRVDTSMPGAMAWGLAGTTRPVMVIVDR